MTTPSDEKDNEHREKVNYHRHLEYLRRSGLDPMDPRKAFACVRRAFPHLQQKQAAKIVLAWVEESRSRTLTGAQNLIIKAKLDIILANIILLEREEDLELEAQGLLREMKRCIRKIAEILQEAESQENKKFLRGILKDLGGIQGILS